MLILADILFYIGYFFVMIFCMIVAIVTAKESRAGVWYVGGALIQLAALLGNECKVYGIDRPMDWIVYFSLLFIAGVIVVKRHDGTIF